MAKPRSNATSFERGKKKTGGRKAGVPNRTTTVLREAVILAAQAVGNDGVGKDGLVGYLMKVANKNMASFCSLLGRVMPLQVETKEHTTAPVVYKSLEEVRAELRRRGLPIDGILPTEPTGAGAD